MLAVTFVLLNCLFTGIGLYVYMFSQWAEELSFERQSVG